ncbi:MAG: GTP 3',8-cyclase MoaA, partial [Firmicutes bacterium]|nr:GTP 3',8-cyclase MoaA [Bacillota bacterium]
TMAGPLAEAGLRRVNVSLDTLREDRFHTLTRGGKLATVWEGIDASLEAGLTPVKLNTIIMRSFNFDEIPALAAVTRERPLHLRFIELMEVGETRGWAKSERVSGQEVKDILEDRFGALEAVGRGGECGLAPGCGPALYYRLPGGEGTIGFIDPSSTGFCDRCNRLRLTADGRLKPCLLAAGEIDVRAPLRAGISDEDLRDLVSQAVQLKPPHQEESPTAYGTRKMFQIGG